MKCWICKKRIVVAKYLPTWNKDFTDIRFREYCLECAKFLKFDTVRIVLYPNNYYEEIQKQKGKKL